MLISFHLNNRQYSTDLSVYTDISIPLLFNGDQPNTYDVDKATAKAYEAGSFVGDTRRGGSCNFEQYTLIPHCNGTHTECIGHITHERISIHASLRDCFIPSTLVSIDVISAEDTDETYTPDKNGEDRLITRNHLEKALKNADPGWARGLIIRTLPNDESKKARRYMEQQPPFFSLEAMKYIAGLNIKHLLVDIPSLDRTFDEGKLSAHHIFWNMPAGSHEADGQSFRYKTITEMIFVPEQVKDGFYLLNLQIAAFAGDASPSRALLFKPV